METGLFHDFFGEFSPHKVKNTIFVWRGACEMRLKPHRVRLNIETNIKTNIPAGRKHGPDGGPGKWGPEWGWGGGWRELNKHSSWGDCGPDGVAGEWEPEWGLVVGGGGCGDQGYPIPISGMSSPIWYPISPIWYPISYLVSHLINESPKSNSLIFVHCTGSRKFKSPVVLLQRY